MSDWIERVREAISKINPEDRPLIKAAGICHPTEPVYEDDDLPTDRDLEIQERRQKRTST